MAGSVFDSPLFSKLFPTGEAGRLFTDAAEIRAMMLVEGTLAKVQGEMGIIPEDSAALIHRSSLEIQIDPGALAEATGQNGVSVPGLVAAFRKAMEAPEHAQFVHWGATSQDIIDTGLMLRLRQVLTLLTGDAQAVLKRLASLASAHAETPMAARTFGQYANVTSFGAQVAEWGNPLISLLEEFPGLRESCLMVSLSGATGTGVTYGPDAAKLRAKMADALRLGDPERSWHTDRTPVLRIADWLVRINGALAKLGEDVIAMSLSGIDEVNLDGGGASSTLPQKQNPVAASSLVALGHQARGLEATLKVASVHKHQRDGAAWFTEWLVLPQICLGAASALTVAKQVLDRLEPHIETVGDPLGLIHAETLSYALVAQMPRPEAQAVTKALCLEARETGTQLQDLIARDYPDLDKAAVFDPMQTMGHAPEAARAFVQRVKKL
ncbi:lyase family protein [uncultured Shimia sp.]|uniref:lyase family protein n=1 Tax=uncultured Shimia sp. TaxID=573152 RepID=UPI0026292811|nr:lyase family protein [uncultured Shimia sp.]